LIFLCFWRNVCGWGTICIFKDQGAKPDHMIVNAPAALKVAFGENWRKRIFAWSAKLGWGENGRYDRPSGSPDSVPAPCVGFSVKHSL
jgi:hypothetical protein